MALDIPSSAFLAMVCTHRPIPPAGTVNVVLNPARFMKIRRKVTHLSARVCLGSLVERHVSPYLHGSPALQPAGLFTSVEIRCGFNLS